MKKQGQELYYKITNGSERFKMIQYCKAIINYIGKMSENILKYKHIDYFCDRII
jgi:hypothetical protein